MNRNLTEIIFKSVNKETGKPLIKGNFPSPPEKNSDISITVIFDNSLSMEISEKLCGKIQGETDKFCKLLPEFIEISVISVVNSQIRLIRDFQDEKSEWYQPCKSKGMSPIKACICLANERMSGRGEEKYIFLISDKKGNDEYFFSDDDMKIIEETAENCKTENISSNPEKLSEYLYWFVRKFSDDDSGDDPFSAKDFLFGE